MSMTSLLSITPWPALSAVILLALLVVALYFARRTAHQAIRAVTDALGRGLRLASHAVARGEERLAARNREVLLSAGREAKERIVEREFVRVGDSVRKDLANYPTLHRALSESIVRIEEDQAKAVEVPPEAPGWVQAVKVIANLEAKNGGTEILEDIHKSMIRAHDEAMDDYRKASGERHALLRKMMPDWRQIQETLGRVNKNVESVLERALAIDRHMQASSSLSTLTCANPRAPPPPSTRPMRGRLPTSCWRQGSASDQVRLDEYFESVRSVEQRLEASLRPQKRWINQGKFPLDRPTAGIPETHVEHVRLMLDCVDICRTSADCGSCQACDVHADGYGTCRTLPE